jgi:hypothetical protein
MSDNSPQRNVVAFGASILLGPIMVWAGFLDLTEASRGSS